MLQAILKEARPKQWLKNILVFAAPGAAGVLGQGDALGKALVAFVAMCMASSGTYFWNDIFDVKSDRQHPTKRFRPIAAGKLSIPVAGAIGTVLLILGSVVAYVGTGWRAAAAVTLYSVITLSYTVVWKHLAVIDLLAIASGFVLRAIVGAFAVDVPMSSWFLLVTAFGSLFIVTGKRYAEANQLGGEAGEIRNTLAEYTPNYLRFVLGVSASAALVSYCLWAFDVKTQIDPALPLLELSVVPMLGAFLRYALVLENGRGAAPEEVFAHDRVLQALGLIWVIIFAAAVYTT